MLLNINESSEAVALADHFRGLQSRNSQTFTADDILFGFKSDDGTFHR